MNAPARVALISAYAVLCLAAAGRSGVQLATKAADAPLPYALSAVAAVLYGVIGWAIWRGSRLTNRIAVVGTTFELGGVLVVGTWGYLQPSLWPDETVWSGFGSGYGWIPLLLPALALWALLTRERLTD